MTASTDAPADGGETVVVPGDIAAALRDYFGAWEEDIEDYAGDYINDEEEAERAAVLRAFQQASAVWADLDQQAVAHAVPRSGAAQTRDFIGVWMEDLTDWVKDAMSKEEKKERKQVAHSIRVAHSELERLLSAPKTQE